MRHLVATLSDACGLWRLTRCSRCMCELQSDNVLRRRSSGRVARTFIVTAELHHRDLRGLHITPSRTGSPAPRRALARAERVIVGARARRPPHSCALRKNTDGGAGARHEPCAPAALGAKPVRTVWMASHVGGHDV